MTAMRATVTTDVPALVARIDSQPSPWWAWWCRSRPCR